MATESELESLHRAAGIPASDSTYPDDLLADIIDETGSVTAAAAQIWQEKAAALAMMVDTTESGSSRKLSDLHKNALTMAEALGGGSSSGTTARRSFTTPIIRP